MSEAATPAPRMRIQSIDILRGLVIVLMALDHTRDYFHAGFAIDPLDPDQTTPILYATRWITHFCAPTFVFLAGVSAWLQFSPDQSTKGKSRGELSRFLLTRGLWLVVLELTVLSFGWSFSFGFFFLQVIWAIGWSMIGLAALVWLPRLAVLAIGVAIIAGHNLLDPIQPEQFGAFAHAWTFTHAPGIIMGESAPLALAPYPVLPWFGIMAFGFGLGALFTAANRDRTFVLIGVGLIALFIALRLINQYGDPAPWSGQDDWGAALMAFLDVAKYPPSLMYVCATLGPVLLLMPLIERMRGPVAEFFSAYGAVPFFFYVLHIYLVHALSLIANAAMGRDIGFAFDYMRNVLFTPQRLEGTGFDLWVVYLAWLLVLAILYPLCRWWGAVKRTRKDWRLSYL